mmetsp:Transcript_10348/g.20955  ORF Transcript_10348/g.20955 Transcript_10348/m.20955 type:complete len:326 (+) Transcript_10348:3080-4057(+)
MVNCSGKSHLQSIEFHRAVLVQAKPESLRCPFVRHVTGRLGRCFVLWLRARVVAVPKFRYGCLPGDPLGHPGLLMYLPPGQPNLPSPHAPQQDLVAYREADFQTLRDRYQEDRQGRWHSGEQDRYLHQKAPVLRQQLPPVPPAPHPGALRLEKFPFRRQAEVRPCYRLRYCRFRSHSLPPRRALLKDEALQRAKRLLGLHRLRCADFGSHRPWDHLRLQHHRRRRRRHHHHHHHHRCLCRHHHPQHRYHHYQCLCRHHHHHPPPPHHHHLHYRSFCRHRCQPHRCRLSTPPCSPMIRCPGRMAQYRCCGRPFVEVSLFPPDGCDT